LCAFAAEKMSNSIHRTISLVQPYFDKPRPMVPVYGVFQRSAYRPLLLFLAGWIFRSQTYRPCFGRVPGLLVPDGVDQAAVLELPYRRRPRCRVPMR
jgi:hypothetical protein